MKIISGFQTGADIAGIKAAVSNNLKTGGHMPKGFKTENGNKPEYADLYNAEETSTVSYIPRTTLNVRNADCSIIFDYAKSSGSINTKKLCVKHGLPFLYLNATDINKYSVINDVTNFINSVETKKLKKDKTELIINIAGNRESNAKGIEKRVYYILDEVFKKLASNKI